MNSWHNTRFYRLVGRSVWNRKNKKVSKFFVVFRREQKPIDIVKEGKNKNEKTPFILSIILSFILSFAVSDRRDRPIGFPWFPGPFPIRSDEKNHVPFLDAARKKQRQDTIAYYPCSMAKTKRASQNAIATLFDMNPVSWTRWLDCIIRPIWMLPYI